MPGELIQVNLTYLDYGIIIGYLALLSFMGVCLRKFAHKDLENYFMGGRKVPGWLNGFSYAATCMNADVAPVYCGMTVICGVFTCWWYLSRFGLALMIGAVLFSVYWRRLKIFTSPEFYELRYQGTPAIAMRSWVSFRSAFIAMVAWSGGGLLGVHKVAYVLLGWEKWQTFCIIIPVLLFYVMLSGYLGVVITDFLQALIIIGSSIVLMILVLVDFGGPTGLYEELLNKFGPSVLSWHPPQSHQLLGIVGVIAWTVGTAVGYGGDVAPMAGAMEGQRLLSCRNAREASKMYMWTEVVLFVMLAVITLPALGAMVKWPGLYDGTINRELAYGMLLGEYLPQGLLGLAIVSILASIMSTISSNMNFGSQVFLNDIYRRSIVKHASLKHYMNVGRIVMLVIIGLAILVATKATNLIDISVFMLGLSSAEITANWGQWWWWRFNGKARLAASFGGPLIFLFNQFVVFKHWIVASSNTEYYVVLCSMGMTCLLWIIVALLTKPDSKECLIAFYKAARPLGWWGPIAREVDEKPSHSRVRPIFTGLLVAGLGAVMVAAGTICISCLYVARWNVAAIAGFVCITVGLVFKKGYNRYMNSLEKEVGLEEE